MELYRLLLVTDYYHTHSPGDKELPIFDHVSSVGYSSIEIRSKPDFVAVMIKRFALK